MMNKVLYIADSLNVGDSGQKTTTLSHMKMIINNFGAKNVVVVNLAGTMIEKDVDYISFSVSNNPFNRITNLLKGNTGKIDSGISKAILSIIESENIEFVFIDNSTYGPLTKTIKTKFPDVKVITFFADVKANLCKEWIKHEPYKFLVYRNVMINEKMVATYGDINLVLNKREQLMFDHFYMGRRSEILKVPVPTPKVDYTLDLKIVKPISVLFLGAYYYPNVNGIKWFVSNVWPLINDGANLVVAGNGMEKLREELSDKSVTVLGRVENLQEVYASADVVIGPIFEGAGMKVKTAEAFAFGKCYIGTTESLTGYWEDIPEEIKGRFIFRADSVSEFVDAFKRVLINQNLRRNNHVIYSFFCKNYSEEAICKNLTQILKETN